MANLIHKSSAEKAVSYSREIGNVVLMLGFSRKYANCPLAPLMKMVNSATALRQYKLYFSADGKPNGLIIWAWLSNFTMHENPICPPYVLPFGEWNEGEHLCLVDVVSSAGRQDEMIADWLANVGAQEEHIYSYPNPPQAMQYTQWQRNALALDVSPLLTHLEAN